MNEGTSCRAAARTRWDGEKPQAGPQRKGYGGRGDTGVERRAREFVRECWWSHVQSTTQGTRPRWRCAPGGRSAARAPAAAAPATAIDALAQSAATHAHLHLAQLRVLQQPRPWIRPRVQVVPRAVDEGGVAGRSGERVWWLGEGALTRRAG